MMDFLRSALWSQRALSRHLLFAFLACGICTGAVRGGEPDLSAHLSVPPDASVKEMLSLLGIGSEFFAVFSDGEPWNDEQQKQLAKLLFRLRQVPRGTMSANAQPAREVNRIAKDPAAHRGEVYSVRCQVQRVRRIDIPSELHQALGFAHYFECDADILGSPCQLIARRIPAAWKLNRAIEEQATAFAMFVKLLPAEVTEDGESKASTEMPALAANSIAWHPATLLGQLGMDYGLFEDVRDRSELTEREAFYQMLAIASRMSPEYLDRQIDRALNEQRELQQRLARNRDLPATMREEAERALERAARGASDIVPLFNEPENQRGRFVVLRGEALRAIKVRVDDADIAKRFGINHYYEIAMITPDSQNYPIICCVSQIPPEMPLGETIHENVRVAGFFLKSWAFDSRRSVAAGGARGERPRQLAPLVIGTRVELVYQPELGVSAQSFSLAMALVAVLMLAGAILWFVGRSERQANAALSRHRDALPEHVEVVPPPDIEQRH